MGDMLDLLVAHAWCLANDMTSKLGNMLGLLANDMASKLGNMLGLLVSHADDPAALKQQVTWLGRRHVLYGVKPHMVHLMGPILLGALADSAGEDNWGQPEEKAWGVLVNIII
ncbi:hypothetical protein T484DRAFT_1836457, partial [Baffinella frigidus]